MPDGRLPDKSDPKFWNRLYHQNADGTFTDVTEKAGLTGMPQNHYGMGVAVGDYDNDGFEDLYVTELRRQHAVPQQRQRHVHGRDEAAPEWRPGTGAPAQGSSTTTTTAGSTCSSRATWIGASRPTATAAKRDRATAPTAIPTTTTGVTNILYHNNGDGTFTDVSAKAGIANPEGQGTRRLLRRLRRRRLHGRVRRQRLGAVLPVSQQRERHVQRGRPAGGRGLQRGRQDLRRHGRGFRRLRQRRPSRHRRHRSLERTLQAVSPERRRQLSGRDQHVRRGRRDAALLGLEHTFLRLRQRRLEGPVRRAGPRDGHDREDLAQSELPAAAAAVAERVRPVRQGDARRRLSAGLGRSRRRFRRPRQRRRHRRGGQQRRPERRRAAQRRRQPQELARDTDGRQEIEPRRDRVPREGRVRIRADSVFHRQHGGRVISRPATSGCSSVSARSPWRSWWRSDGRPELVQKFENVKAGRDAGRDRAGFRGRHGRASKPHRLGVRGR